MIATSAAVELPTEDPLHPPCRLAIVVGIATRGRPEVLARTLAQLGQQRRQPDMIIVAYSERDDIANADLLFPHVIFVPSEPGLTKQRNAILDCETSSDVVVFLDDDFYAAPGYLVAIENLFREEKNVAVATGRVLADGVNGPGLQQDEALWALTKSVEDGYNNNVIRPVFNAYGCNMCLRVSLIREHSLRFDEALPLYGWYEDVDFSRQLARFGRVVKLHTATGVHLGVKNGRTSGVRLGYSQIANPIYLFRKGTFPFTHAVYSIGVRLAKNLVRTLAPEPYVDRKGRALGNLLGLRDLLSGRLHPLRAVDL